MKSVKIATLKDQLSMHLRAVERGATYIVTDRDRPVAKLAPIAPDEGFEIVPASKPFAAARRKRFKPTREAVDSLRLLLEERGVR